MSLRFLALMLLIGLLSVHPSTAKADFNSAAIQAISRVEDDGFAIISVSRTFLGRVKVVSENQTYRRETVFHAVTIEVLQDRLTRIENDTPSQDGQSQRASPPTQDRNNSSSSNASSSDGRFGSQTSGRATGGRTSSSSTSTTTGTHSSTTTTHSDGSVSQTNSTSSSTSASSTATAGD